MIPTTHRTLKPANRLRNEMDQLFTGMLGSIFEPTRARSSDPALDILENEEGYLIEIAVPGLTLDELDVSIADEALTVRGERQEQEQHGGTYLRRERRRTMFQRVVRLPKTVEADKIEASLENGILSIRVPRAEAAKPRQIPVRIANLIETAATEPAGDES